MKVSFLKTKLCLKHSAVLLIIGIKIKSSPVTFGLISEEWL